MKASTAKILLLAALVLGLTGVAMAGLTANHTVNLGVSAINEVSVTGGTVTLLISTATAGSAPDDAIDSSTATLNYTTNSATAKKISAKIGVALGTGLTLKVQPASPGVQVTLSTTDQEVIGSLTLSNNSKLLTYTFQATSAAGVVTAADYTITYTMADDA